MPLRQTLVFLLPGLCFPLANAPASDKPLSLYAEDYQNAIRVGMDGEGVCRIIGDSISTYSRAEGLSPAHPSVRRTPSGKAGAIHDMPDVLQMVR